MNDDRSQQLSEVIAEYLQAAESGDAPDRDALLSQHPDVADELRAFFAEHDRLQAVADPNDDITIRPSSNDNGTTIPPKSDDATSPPPGSDANLPPATATAPTVGTKLRYFGDYELLEEIARGGMGVVYKAKQTKLNRIVALKMILAGQLARDEDVQRFHAEAEAAANLDHPGIVPIFEIGEHEGQHYFSMGFVEGESLADKIKDGPLAPRVAAEYVRKIAEAMAFAHEKGVIHRDLKPSNVLIDANDQPKVMDFGLAKTLETDSQLTGTGQILGTPSYMPPEQASGKTGDVDERADVYALGAILYCLLIGRPPFQAASPVDTLLQVLDQDPAPLRSVNGKIPRDLETICLKCLRKEPEKRFVDAAALDEDLRRYLTGEPITARPVSRTEKAWLWCRRHPVHVGAAAAIILMLAVSVGVIAANRAANNRTRAESLANAILTAPPDAVPDAIDAAGSLRQHVGDYLRTWLESGDLPPAQRLHAACGLAEQGEVRVREIVSLISSANDGECANIISALLHANDEALRELSRRAGGVESDEDWITQARMAVVALHLGDPSLAAEMLEIEDRPDPIQRIIMIEVLPVWHGDLVQLAALVEHHPQDHFCSGICLAVGGIAVADVNDEEKSAWCDLLQNWFVHHTGAVTHSASEWSLRQWLVEIPQLPDSRTPLAGQDWWHAPHNMTMLRIPRGRFTRTVARPDAQPQVVRLTADVWLSDREITVGLFQRFVDDENYSGLKPDDWSGAHLFDGETNPALPVQQVSWFDAVMFCNWMSSQYGLVAYYAIVPTGDPRPELAYAVTRLGNDGIRLPTEAEWEYACRSGTNSDFCFGDDESRLGDYGWFYGNSNARTHAGAQQHCNNWGLFDMHGNVFEWCWDWYAEYGDELDVQNPEGAAQGTARLIRGGNWNSNPRTCQSSSRGRYFPAYRDDDLGFRVARSPRLSSDVAVATVDQSRP